MRCVWCGRDRPELPHCVFPAVNSDGGKNRLQTKFPGSKACAENSGALTLPDFQRYAVVRADLTQIRRFPEFPRKAWQTARTLATVQTLRTSTRTPTERCARARRTPATERLAARDESIEASSRVQPARFDSDDHRRTGIPVNQTRGGMAFPAANKADHGSSSPPVRATQAKRAGCPSARVPAWASNPIARAPRSVPSSSRRAGSTSG